MVTHHHHHHNNHIDQHDDDHVHHHSNNASSPTPSSSSESNQHHQQHTIMINSDGTSPPSTVPDGTNAVVVGCDRCQQLHEEMRHAVAQLNGKLAQQMARVEAAVVVGRKRNNDAGMVVVPTAEEAEERTEQQQQGTKGIPTRTNDQFAQTDGRRQGNANKAETEISFPFPTMEQIFVCEICQQKCSGAKGRASHMNMRNKGHPAAARTPVIINREFSCTKCPESFETKRGLTSHSRWHGAGHLQECGQCDYTCTTPNRLQLHRDCHARAADVRRRVALDEDDDDGQIVLEDLHAPPAAFIATTTTTLVPTIAAAQSQQQQQNKKRFMHIAFVLDVKMSLALTKTSPTTPAQLQQKQNCREQN